RRRNSITTKAQHPRPRWTAQINTSDDKPPPTAATSTTLLAAALNIADASSSNGKFIRLPPSKTGTRGVLSKCTLELCHALRCGSSSSVTSDNDSMLSIPGTPTPLVLISGMRTTTLFQQLPYLPWADAYVSESGGRIFYPVPLDESSDGYHKMVISNKSGLDNSPFRLMEDLQWKHQISNVNAAVPDGFNDDTLLPLEQSSGKLWAFATQLQQHGYILDTMGYSTAFRITQHIHDNFDKVIHQIITTDLLKELRCSTNLGCIDIYPAMTCKMAFLPSVTSESIQSLIERQRLAWSDEQDDDNDTNAMLQYGRLIVTEDVERGNVESGTMERALEMIMTELQKDNDDGAL
ncbi:hypothetical protein ACHAXN_003487, partial [Cyclotella atomus]